LKKPNQYQPKTKIKHKLLCKQFSLGNTISDGVNGTPVPVLD